MKSISEMMIGIEIAGAMTNENDREVARIDEEERDVPQVPQALHRLPHRKVTKALIWKQIDQMRLINSPLGSA